MKADVVLKETLPTSKAFKAFWKEKGPFAYALTCSEFPPVLLEEEQWLFSDDLTGILKALMQFKEQKMKFVRMPFNPRKKAVLRPENLSEWKINHFPEEWNMVFSPYFIPEGHLTCKVINSLEEPGKDIDAQQMEAAFFNCLAMDIHHMGYTLLVPGIDGKKASIKAYLEEWEQDEKEAGFF